MYAEDIVLFAKSVKDLQNINNICIKYIIYNIFITYYAYTAYGKEQLNKNCIFNANTGSVFFTCEGYHILSL